MHEPKYKIGDRVRIIRTITTEEHDLWWDVWIDQMDNFIGRVATIKGVYLWKDKSEFCRYTFKEFPFSYPEFVLELEIKTGEQLEFSFMMD